MAGDPSSSGARRTAERQLTWALLAALILAGAAFWPGGEAGTGRTALDHGDALLAVVMVASGAVLWLLGALLRRRTPGE